MTEGMNIRQKYRDLVERRRNMLEDILHRREVLNRIDREVLEKEEEYRILQKEIQIVEHAALTLME